MNGRADEKIKKTPSLRRQLSIWLIAAMVALWLFGITGATLLFRDELEEIFDAALQDTAETVLPLAGSVLVEAIAPFAEQLSADVENNDAIAFIVTDENGRIILKSPRADVKAFAKPAVPGFSETDRLRVFAKTNDTATLTIQVAQPLAERREVLRDTFLALLVPLLILLPAGIVLTSYLIRRSLRPVARLSDAVRTRSVTDLTPVPAAYIPTELLPVQVAVNMLLGRLSRSLEAERSFTADAAHELRTPIAATLAQTQRLIAEATPGDLRTRAKGIEVALKRLAHLAEKLLQKSRADGGGVLATTPQDLAPILDLVVEDFRRTDQASQLQVSLPVDGTTPSPMDPDAFAILARNLIENALKHGDVSAAVEIVLLPDGTLIVTNGGAPVAPGDMARLTERFKRAGGSTVGSGLGLAIALSIAVGAGQRLKLTSPAPGRSDGFEARLQPLG